eukprot:CAMPEP_0115037126 /NCGR_PEP_ID=MMETSP0216-20121206/42583_1 /TAXON_ID=223996 /ORGANISM="Protocruzia adherens, Strain Boccale" /LENGTH=273 /DNA_ID=CAMNT_0002417187 /DNA_START=41 /DNA_END=862 /DNA_ORIENTATION=+
MSQVVTRSKTRASKAEIETSSASSSNTLFTPITTRALLDDSGSSNGYSALRSIKRMLDGDDTENSFNGYSSTSFQSAYSINDSIEVARSRPLRDFSGAHLSFSGIKPVESQLKDEFGGLREPRSDSNSPQIFPKTSLSRKVSSSISSSMPIYDDRSMNFINREPDLMRRLSQISSIQPEGDENTVTLSQDNQSLSSFLSVNLFKNNMDDGAETTANFDEDPIEEEAGNLSLSHLSNHSQASGIDPLNTAFINSQSNRSSELSQCSLNISQPRV